MDYVLTPVVLDNGSGMIKAGYAGEEIPKSFFPSYVGRPKHTRIMAGAVDGDVFIGAKAQELRGLLKIRYPLEHGIVTDWDDMEKIWSYIYSEELKTLPEEHPVLLTEAPLNPRVNRDQAAQIFFETFNVPAMFTSIQAVLSLYPPPRPFPPAAAYSRYASGRTTGVVIDSGDGVTHSVPVYEGFAVPPAIRRIDIAGRDVTEHLQLLLRKAGATFHTSAEKEIVRTIKEKMCYVAEDPRKEEKEWGGVPGSGSGGLHNKGQEYALPDGRKIKLGAERFRATEILFNPEIIGTEYQGVHEMLFDSINRTDLDLRRKLFETIVLSGGTTLSKGFGQRVKNELERLAVKGTKIKIYAPPERKYTTWIGGSILAALGTFRKMWVSAEEYQEDPEIIHRKAI